jgi:ATP-binding cassette subfamily B protein
MRPHARAAAGILTLLLVGVALDLLSPQLTRVLVDRVLPGAAASAAGEKEAIAMLTVVVGALAVVQALRALVNVVNGSLAARVGTAITFDIRSRLVERLQQLSIGYYDRQQVGSLVGRVAYDTESMHGFIWQITGGFILQIVMIVGVFAMMFTLDWRLALLALLPAPLVMGGTIYFWRRVYPRYHRSWEASSRQAGALSGMLSGIRVVKLFGQERREADRFKQDSARLRSARLGVDGANAVFGGVVGLFFQIGGWIIWYAGGRGVIHGTLTLGELMAFFGYLWMFYGPLAALPQFTNWFSQFTTQANRVFEVLDTPEAIRPPENPVHIAPVRGDIAFESVTFGYDPHDPVIRALDLKVRSGERLGIVGPSGSGKSSLIQLLCRFYDPAEGRVTLDGVDIRDVEKDELRRSIGIVLQEPFLFRGTIADNLAYGDPAAPPSRVIGAAIAADCHDFILKHPHAYDTWLGERGVGLSGGERQRLGIARTLLSDPRVLVLDEATSSIDPDSESYIRDSLEAWTSGRTTIAIAHRLSTLRDTHRVIVLENGRIVEEGPPEELLAAGGVFARMCRAQGLESFQPRAHSEPRVPRWLTPDNAAITEGPRGSLIVHIDGEFYSGVYALPCMPVHHPEDMLSLRRGQRGSRLSEIGIIVSLGEWPQAARELVDRSLARRYYVPIVRGIESLEVIHNYLSFEVETDAGPAAFLTRWTPESVVEYGNDGRMIIASDASHYLIPRVGDLPERDQRLFLRHVYW